MSNKMKVAIYCRVSHENDFAINEQERRLLDYAKANDIEIATVYKDNGVSGLGFDRPAYTDLESAIRHGEVDAVLIKDLSRAARGYAEATKWLKWLYDNGVVLISADGVDYRNVSAPLSEIIRNIATRNAE